jgi:hypothetical protein
MMIQMSCNGAYSLLKLMNMLPSIQFQCFQMPRVMSGNGTTAPDGLTVLTSLSPTLAI